MDMGRPTHISIRQTKFQSKSWKTFNGWVALTSTPLPHASLRTGTQKVCSKLRGFRVWFSQPSTSLFAHSCILWGGGEGPLVSFRQFAHRRPRRRPCARFGWPQVRKQMSEEIVHEWEETQEVLDVGHTIHLGSRPGGWEERIVVVVHWNRNILDYGWFSLNISPKVKCHQFDGRDYCDFFFTHRVYKPTVHLNVVMCDADDDTLLFLAAAARNVIWWRHLSPCTHQTGQKLSMSSVRLSVKMYSWTFKTARIWLQIAIHASALDESWAKRHKTCSFVIAILNVF